MPSIMQSNIENRVSKIKLPKEKFLMPLFEAVSNSLQAIEDKFENNIKNGKIIIKISRDDTNQTTFDRIDKSLLPIKNILISDNGIGFNADNFKSFTIYDSPYKKNRGGKGEGRLYWLKVFDKALISSVYSENNYYKHIEFPFSIADEGIDSDNIKTTDSKSFETGACVKLINIKDKYKDLYLIQLETIAKKIIKHFVSYFIDENCPQIIIEEDSNRINLNDYFKNTWLFGDIFTTNLNIIDKEFKLCFIKLKESGNSNHKLHLCADKREVEEYNLKDYIANLYSKLGEDTEDKYYYHVFVYSDYLNKLVKPDRSGFNSKEEDMKLLFPLNIDDIIKNLITRIKNELNEELEKIKTEKLNRITNYIKTSSPQYRILLNDKYIEKLDDIKPNKKGKDLELDLYELLYQLNRDAKRNANNLLKKNLEKVEDKEFFNNRIKEYLEQVSEVGKSQLAEYIVNRKALLELLSKLQKENINGKYALEDAVHDTIFPMKCTSDDIDYTQHNLWAIDEKLAYHYYLASDKKLNQIDCIESDSDKRPDIAIFDYPIMLTPDEKLSTITLIEFKRPERDDYTDEENPIKQIVDYVKLLRESKKKSKNGETINITPNTPIYAYIVASLTPKLKDVANDAGYLTISPDGLGYFGFHPTHKIYFEIVSYKKMIQDASDRNKILFDKLNL